MQHSRNDDCDPGPCNPDLNELSLDPTDWKSVRALAHAALDDALNLIERVRERPVWRPVPCDIQRAILEPLPIQPQGLQETYSQFQKEILPYATGNIHPRFWGWVHGSGMVSGVVAEMMGAAMNSNCGGRDHGAVYVERAVIEWCKQMFGYSAAATGILVSGTSMGTMIGLAVARNARGKSVRTEGVANSRGLVAYTSSEAHESVVKAFELLGLGRNALRRVPVNQRFEIDLEALQNAIEADRTEGRTPFCVIGTVGTVNTGAIDNIAGLADLASREDLWFHVDGAFGALCVLSEVLRPRVSGIERADSISFDFHKWLHVPYDAGCVLVKDGAAHWSTFTSRPEYLRAASRGLAAGNPWFCEYGPELSRGFRALKIWFALKEHGANKLGELILQNCRQAEYLAELVRSNQDLQLLSEPSLNIVCFRFFGQGLGNDTLDPLNWDIVASLQERGIAAPSTTQIDGKLAIRVNLTNHRTRCDDLKILIEAVVSIGKEICYASV